MEKIWENMAITILPSWIDPAPPNWGSKKRGKLSADNWRVICTIHLPVTLIWLWRNESGRKKALITNFMHLVTAARIVNQRLASDFVFAH